jgi:hypothetical protein
MILLHVCGAFVFMCKEVYGALWPFPLVTGNPGGGMSGTQPGIGVGEIQMVYFLTIDQILGPNFGH